ncbi:hypothetical protein OJF2_34560 [Aquisphaera giovannonii]|uniref:Uncharacterized protein n=1 Tax=Aquisphaera giovannonii TaxID=406548 RepID=A0A5B9W4C2_9BACT|nr:DUF6404 family protein [Aquisphaera giovannonii]QEH34911.1 hypothetical protein OJF2_34560 [Aquisphaera giovannonii]
MTHRDKVERFIAEMTQRGVNPYTAAPPAWRTAWGLGIEVPPPHFMAFVLLALTSGLFFGTLWGLAMRLVDWGALGWLSTMTVAAVAGALFGVCLAAYYRRSAARLELPSWERYAA